MDRPVRVTRERVKAAVERTEQLIKDGVLPHGLHRHDHWTPYEPVAPGSRVAIPYTGMMNYMCSHAERLLRGLGVPFKEEVRLGDLRAKMDDLCMVGETSALQVFDRQEPCLNGLEEVYTYLMLSGGVIGNCRPVLLKEGDDVTVILDEVLVKGDDVLVYGRTKLKSGAWSKPRRVMTIGQDAKAWSPG